MAEEKRTLLKNLKVSSVDLCEQGANQKAYICLKKSEDKRKDGFFNLLGECSYSDYCKK